MGRYGVDGSMNVLHNVLNVLNVLHKPNRRKIRLIESNAKCRYLRKFTSPLHTVFVYTVYLSTQRRGEEITREITGAIVHNAVRKYQHD